MAGATGVRVVFFGSHKRPSYVVETCSVPEMKDLSEGEILIKILMMTICPMDLDHIDGRREVVLPCVLGHEGVGEVIYSRRTANGSPAFHTGDRVTFTTVSKCGCFCSSKNENQEPSTTNTKFGGSSVKDKRLLNGCYSSHMVLRATAQVVRVPDNVPDEAACLANCALATMVHAVSYLPLKALSKHSMAIVQGANLRGLFGCALLHNAGFDRVYCHDIAPEKLRLVPKFGGIPVLVNKEYDCNGTDVDQDYENVDVVIDVCGSWDIVSYGLNVLRPQGIYIFVGTPHEEHTSSMDIDPIIKKCITVKGIQSYSVNHLEDAVKFLSAASDHFPFGSLISSPLPLQEFHNAVKLARTNRFCRTAIRPQVIQTT